MADEPLVTARKGGGAQTKRSSANRFTPAKRRAFLRHLAATANVVQSSAAAGVSNTAVYATRAKDPSFAADWQAALTEAYHALELKLLDQALNGQRIVRHTAEGDVVEVRQDTGTMLRLLAHHRAGVKGRPVAVPSPDRAKALRERMHKDLALMAERLGVTVPEGTGPADPPA